MNTQPEFSRPSFVGEMLNRFNLLKSCLDGLAMSGICNPLWFVNANEKRHAQFRVERARLLVDSHKAINEIEQLAYTDQALSWFCRINPISTDLLLN